MWNVNHVPGTVSCTRDAEVTKLTTSVQSLAVQQGKLTVKHYLK